MTTRIPSVFLRAHHQLLGGGSPLGRLLPPVGLVDTRRVMTSTPPTQQIRTKKSDVDPPKQPRIDPFKLVEADLSAMNEEIHEELDAEMKDKDSELLQMAKYYFDGKGKAIRPVTAMILGHAFNHHMGKAGDETIVRAQRKVSIISEMIHTASLVHDDVLDHAETRRGKVAINRRWNEQKSIMCGDNILAVGAKVLAQLRNEEVLIILAKVLDDLVVGEFEQLQNTPGERERMELYMKKTFHKTASLIARSCEANAVLSGASTELVQAAFEYGRRLGIAFQLVDDLLDFESSSELLGKPGCGADLRLGLATLPVLYATEEYPVELNKMIGRRFAEPGDVEAAFEMVRKSAGLEKSRQEARRYCDGALKTIEGLKDSEYKCALVDLVETVLTRKK